MQKTRAQYIKIWPRYDGFKFEIKGLNMLVGPKGKTDMPRKRELGVLKWTNPDEELWLPTSLEKQRDWIGQKTCWDIM